jgi:hypothetical protein
MKNITLATIKSILKNGGATINKNGVRIKMKSGYQVSIHDIAILPVEQFNKYILKELITRLSSKGEYLGVWVDDNKVYIDISRRIPTKAKAVEEGKRLNQISILKWKNMECIAVGEG